VDLRGKPVQVRYDRQQRDRFIVYFNGKRMGEATLLDLHQNARTNRLYRHPPKEQGASHD
jgi:hypothetical protein